MERLLYMFLLLTAALGTIAPVSTNAASLGLTTQDPTVASSAATIDYLEFGVDGDLSTFGAEINSFDGVIPLGFTELSFGIGFALADPTTGATGGFDIFDDNGLFLEGDLLAVGFTQDTIEFQFGNLTGSAATDFGTSVLALIAFEDPLGTNPFDGLVDGEFYSASISVSSVVSQSVPEPGSIALFASALLIFGALKVSLRHSMSVQSLSLQIA